MSEGEIAKELIDFLDTIGQYYDFLEWASERGFDSTEMERDIEQIQENN